MFGKLSILYVVFWLLAMGEKHQWSNDQIKCLLETCIEEVNLHGTAADREFMTQLRDEIAEQLMQTTE